MQTRLDATGASVPTSRATLAREITAESERTMAATSAQSAARNDDLINAIDPDDYVSEARQRELIELADSNLCAAAVRLAIREGVAAALTKMQASAPQADQPGRAV
jgi:hypothetical protein